MSKPLALSAAHRRSRVVRFVALGTVVAAIALGVSAPADAVGGIDMPDDNLRACANAWIGQKQGQPRSPDAEITVVDAASATFIGCGAATYGVIKDLTGIEYFDRAGTMGFSGHTLSDLSPFSRGLPVSYLDLNNNAITDITPLSALDNLRNLYLQNNAITDISGLSAFFLRLTDLNLDGQSVDLGALEVGKATENPVTDANGGAVPLMGGNLYDVQTNTFTPAGSPGAGTPQTWNTRVAISGASADFTGELTYTQSERSKATGAGGGGLTPQALSFLG